MESGFAIESVSRLAAIKLVLDRHEKNTLKTLIRGFTWVVNFGLLGRSEQSHQRRAACGSKAKAVKSWSTVGINIRYRAGIQGRVRIWVRIGASLQT